MTENEAIEQAYRGQVAKLFDVLVDNEIMYPDKDNVALFLKGLSLLRQIRGKAINAIKEN